MMVSFLRFGSNVFIAALVFTAGSKILGRSWVESCAIAAIAGILVGIQSVFKRSCPDNQDEPELKPDRLEGQLGIVTVTIMPRQWGEVAVNIDGRTYRNRARGTNPEDTIQEGETVTIDFIQPDAWIVKRRVGGAR